MRFPQVEVGQQFTFQDKRYTKTGPLTASEEGTGSQRMIPRSAEVTLLNAVGEPLRVNKQHFTRAEMESSLAAFKVTLAKRLQAAAVDDSLPLELALSLLDKAEFGD